VCLWLLLQFQWSHAFGLAIVVWLVVTLTLLPIVLSKIEETAKQRAVPTSTAAQKDLTCLPEYA
jgi:heme exporter protein D